MKRTLIEEMIIAAARAIVAVADAADNTENNNTTVKKAKAAKKAEPVEDDVDDTEAADVDQETGGLEEKTTKELYQMCVDAGIKVPKYGKNKQFYIAALNDAGIGDDAKAEEAADDGDEDEDKYAGKTAKELFELCKKRGIKAAPKKKAEFYIDLLKKADDAEGDEDDDWGDEDDTEDEPAPAPKKTAATKKATTTKKQAKKAAPADDEDDGDDDWDI